MTNENVRLVYGRYLPFLSRIPILLGRRFVLNNKFSHGYDNYVAHKKKMFGKAYIISDLYKFLILFDYYFQLIGKIIVPRLLGYSIVSDRYVYDTIINDIAVDMNLNLKDVRRIIDRFWSIAPKPDITFFVRIPEELAFKRKKDIPSLSYLKVRNDLYNKLSLHERFVTVDGTMNPEQLEDIVMKSIHMFLNQRYE